MTGQKVASPERSNHYARRKVATLSLEEQISLLAGSDFWRTVPIPEKGVPSIKTTDGPNGARGAFFTDGTPAALFPCGVSLAATWNLALLNHVGKHLAEETKARGADVLLGPTVCMHRSPLGGRNFESFSEDPYLTGKIAASYIQGLQSQGIAATIKHFVGNEQETHRMSIDSLIAERALREIFLRPFEIAIRESRPLALMSSYNLLNGVHADMNRYILQTILRKEWSYEGLVMSDWTGVNSVSDSIAAGCDLEMPGPTKWRGERALRAVLDGELSEADVEACATSVLHLIDQTKGLDGPLRETPERASDEPDRRHLIRQAGIEGLVLLKNEDCLLPLVSKHGTIAVIGPNSKRAIAGGGGSASLNPYYVTTPFDSIQAISKREVLYSRGCAIDKWLPLASDFCRTYSGKAGVMLEYYRGDRLQGDPTVIQHKTQTDLFLWDSAPKEVLPAYSFRVKAQIVPVTTGLHTIGFSSVGPGRLFINGELFIDNWDWKEEGEAMFDGSADVFKQIRLEGGRAVDLLVESNNEIRPASKIEIEGQKHGYGGCRIGYAEESRTDLLQEAVDMAKMADVAVVCVGLDAEWESEGYDRQTMDLPKDGSQDLLVEAIVDANPNTIVINQSGTPVTMPWADKVPAIIQAWYQGQEAGNALADVLFGIANPSGKLPVTFPKRLADNPAYHNWPGENKKVLYGEGIYVGYRHYERLDLAPQFPFGHGLSYTTFEYGKPAISSETLLDSSSISVAVPITNTGVVGGSEIVQAYIHDPKSRLPRPEKELQAFTKVALGPGETKTAHLEFDKYSVGYYDEKLGSWIAEEGVFDVLIGASSCDIRCSVSFMDPRQFIPPSGQEFTTLAEMSSGGKYENRWEQDVDNQRMWSIWTEPKFAIGQRAILIQTEQGNVLWDLITYLDTATVEFRSLTPSPGWRRHSKINSLGGLSAIVISHPHYYTTYVEWATTFKCPVYMSEEDKGWICRSPPDNDGGGSTTGSRDEEEGEQLRQLPLRRFIRAAREEIVPGVLAIKTGGHFDGSLVLLWEEEEPGRPGRLLIADTMLIVPSGRYHINRPPGTSSFAFMWSIPNMIPLPPREILNIWRAIKPLRFTATHGAFLGMDIRAEDVKGRVLESMKIQVRAEGYDEHVLLQERVED
ncbi:MAG: hypothetical protein M1837_001534 [Sclerophora amabilis]|nr:MAG: hypothetical protein M1837_001534 [Sclerophora amabilis]